MVGEFGAPPEIGVVFAHKVFGADGLEAIFRNHELDTGKAGDHLGTSALRHQTIFQAPHCNNQAIADLFQPAGMAC